MNRKAIETLVFSFFAALGLLIIYLLLAWAFSEAEEGNEAQQKNGDFILTVAPNKPFKIGIIGETKLDEDLTFNKVILQNLLKILKNNHVRALFLNGGLISAKHQISENPKTTEEFFKIHLEQLMSLLRGSLGNKTSIFALMGNDEFQTPNARSAFQQEFRLQKSVAFSPKSFGYGVSIASAYFVMLSNDDESNVAGEAFPQEMLDWLKTTLNTASKTHEYLFVMGHRPAFPTVSNTLEFSRLIKRDAFWNILIDAGVLAYFASDETLFDRSNQKKVWQIISGGGGAIHISGNQVKPFYHCLILTIPGDKKNHPPKVEIYDTEGNVRDIFELTPVSPLLHQLHIS